MNLTLNSTADELLRFTSFNSTSVINETLCLNQSCEPLTGLSDREVSYFKTSAPSFASNVNYRVKPVVRNFKY